MATLSGGIADVTIHPLVLLSAADHYHRVARGTRKRVVGVLLGQIFKGRVDATNSFAVPFEEDSKNPSVFYLDHNYLDSMLTMFRKINAKERVVGFYSTGPQIRPNDLRIHDVCKEFCFTPGFEGVFCIIDVRPGRPALPVTAYKVVPVTAQSSGAEASAAAASSSSSVQRTFAHVPCQMGAQEAEEIGVEHLLRDINDPTISTVASLIKGKMNALTTLTEKLHEARDYLYACSRNEVRYQPEIVANCQTIISLLPNLNTEELVHSMIVKTNDMHMAIYLASLIRSVIALHDLINNKIRYGEATEEKPPVVKPVAATAAVQEEKKEDKP